MANKCLPYLPTLQIQYAAEKQAAIVNNSDNQDLDKGSSSPSFHPVPSANSTIPVVVPSTSAAGLVTATSTPKGPPGPLSDSLLVEIIK